jgi:hypothetical protein
MDNILVCVKARLDVIDRRNGEAFGGIRWLVRTFLAQIDAILLSGMNRAPCAIPGLPPGPGHFHQEEQLKTLLENKSLPLSLLQINRSRTIANTESMALLDEANRASAAAWQDREDLLDEIGS